MDFDSLIQKFQSIKSLKINEITSFDENVHKYKLIFDLFVKEIYSDITKYLKTFIMSIRSHVLNIVMDIEHVYDYDREITSIKNQLDNTLYKLLKEKIDKFLDRKSEKFVKLYDTYFVLNVPYIIPYYLNKVKLIYSMIKSQKIKFDKSNGNLIVLASVV